ncbi:MAG: sigma 54-interacting transcriptional regulator [Clostridiaceae bacterium]|nr:sigma 54-interacting transcriptional regulator [Clostridiaceae bacterium]
MKRIDRILEALKEATQEWKFEDLSTKIGFSASEIATQLNLTRANVSNDLNQLVREKQVLKVKTYPVRYISVELVESLTKKQWLKDYFEIANVDEFYQLINRKIDPTHTTNNPFDNLIGSRDSLKKAVTQAKAAVYYPPNGLHILLLGPTGSGKTFFAQKIYQYAIYEKLLKSDAPFKSFNCADYHHNPQLLLSQLFGYVKGAFTGAIEDRPGLVEDADGGILLLDEVHRLSPEGQEMLFYFIDHGRFNRLGENGFRRQSKLLIICATTEDPNSSLLGTFLRRIPMTIEIPALAKRSIKERVELTKYLFFQEAKRVERILRIDNEVIQALVFMVDYGNVGQLKSQVQLICAQGFLNNLYQENEMRITMNELPEDLKVEWMNQRRNNKQIKYINQYLDISTTIYPNQERENEGSEYDDFNIYELIYDKVKILNAEGISKSQIDQYIQTDLHLHIKKVVSKQSINYNLLKFVHPNVTLVIPKIKEVLEEELNIVFDHRFAYYLGMHLDGFLKRGQKANLITEFEMSTIRMKNEIEYQAALLCRPVIEHDLKIIFPDIEVAYLTMLIASLKTLDEEKKISVLVVAHGNQTAHSMVQVGKELLGDAPIYALDMPLTMTPEEIFEKIVLQIKQLNQGKGVLMLVDMGSLAMMNHRLQQATHIPIKTIPNVTTSMVLDVIRKVNYMDLELNAVYESVMKDFTNAINVQIQNDGRKKVILSICTSGQGTAIKLEKFLRKIINESTEESIDIINLSSLRLTKELPEILKKYQIIASVGNKNPKIDAPFIALEQMIEGSGETFLRSLLTNQVILANKKKNTPVMVYDLCKDTLNMYLLYLNPSRITDILIDWCEELQSRLNQNFANTLCIKLIVHTAFAFERVIKEDSLKYSDIVDDELERMMHIVQSSLQPIEKKLKLPLSKDEYLFISEVICQEIDE